MTALVVSTLAAALALPGVYGLEVDPPQAAPVIGRDWVGFFGRFAWGPVSEIHVVDGQADYLDTYAPGGQGYSSTGHKSLARAKAAQMKVVRVGATGFGAPTSGAVANAGTPGSTTYTYKVVAVAGTKVGAATAALTTTTGNVTLSGTDYNTVSWAAPTAGIDITGYRVYRTAGGATQGLIATVAGDVLSLNDTGLAGDSASVPTVNSTVMATASMVLQAPASVNLLNVAAKYPGDLGSSVVITIAAADDGVAAHFNLTAQLGTEVEVYRNLSALSSGAGVVLGDQSASKILAALSAVTANLGSSTRPVNGTYTLGVTASNVASPVAGSDGVSLATDYTGTAGQGDAGLALFEGDADVTIVAPDDCGASRRAAVNAAIVAHVEASTRLGYVVFDSGTSLTAASASLASYRSERAILAWPWVYVLDATGARILVPSAAIRAGALSKMPRHLGQHWKDNRNASSFSGVVALEYAPGRANLIVAQNAGISPLVPAANAWAPKTDSTTSLVAGHTKVARRRLADYVMRLATAGQEPYEGGPIDPATRSRQLAQVNTALQPLVDAGRRGEGEVTEIIAAFDARTASSGADLASGVHKIQVRVQSYATQDVILFLLTVGPTVTIEELPVAA